MVHFDKIPPQNLEAELSVLGAMLLDREAVTTAAELLKPEDFYHDSHRLVFEVMQELMEKGEPVDMVTVAEALRSRGNLEKAGGIPFVASLANSVPTAAGMEYHAKIVVEKSLLRRLIKAATTIAAMGYESSGEVGGLLDQAERTILEISQRQALGGFTNIRPILMDTFDKIDFLYRNKGNLTGVPSFFTDLDRMTSGWQPSDLIIIAARPSMGKTALVLNMAQNAAVRQKVPVGIFSLEMSKEQLVQRMLCAEAMVDQQRVRTGNLLESDWPQLALAVGPLSEAPIFIDDTVGISVGELRAKARRLKAEHGLGLIVIDYLQLMSGAKRTESRQQEVAQISRGLKSVARELNVPVIALSQLNRSVEQRQDKKPIMSDLLESGAIEADADLIAFIYRDEYYNKEESSKKGVAEIIIAKHRNGPVGVVELGFLKEYTKFVNLDHKYNQPA